MNAIVMLVALAVVVFVVQFDEIQDEITVVERPLKFREEVGRRLSLSPERE